MKKNGIFLSIAFVEGGALMAVELISAKLIATFFGVSLYVWATVLALTLLGLAIGYYIGGLISETKENAKKLLKILIASAVIISLLPHLGTLIMNFLLPLGFEIGILISGLFIVFPPLLCFGTISPLIIALTVKEVEKTGAAAGTVYGISTLGGIFATFLFGFYIIPYKGIMISCYITAIALICISLPLILALYKKQSTTR